MVGSSLSSYPIYLFQMFSWLFGHFSPSKWSLQRWFWASWITLIGFFYDIAVYLQINLEEYSYLYNMESSHSEYGLAHLLFKSSFMSFSKIL